MVTLGMLWLPILVSAVMVFFASFAFWMILPHHKSDYRPLPDEGSVTSALRKQKTAPGQYMLPHCGDAKNWKDPAFQKKLEEGPVAYITVKPTGAMNMGRPLALSFSYNLLVAVYVAYLAGRTTAVGAPYLAVFRVAGAATTLAYIGATFYPSIWMGKPWRTTVKDCFDGLAYGLLTGGVFGWLWPR